MNPPNVADFCCVGEARASVSQSKMEAPAVVLNEALPFQNESLTVTRQRDFNWPAAGCERVLHQGYLRFRVVNGLGGPSDEPAARAV